METKELLYNYYELVKEDVKNYLKENYGNKRAVKKVIKENPNFWEDLYDTLFVDDSVTGNASGSYTFNAEKAKRIVTHWRNEDIVQDTIKELSIDMSEHHGDWEYLDVSARCYVLGSCISEIEDEYKMEKITKTMIREAIKNKEIELLHKLANKMNTNFFDLIYSQKCKKEYIENCNLEYRKIRFKRINQECRKTPSNIELRISVIHHLKNEIDLYKRGFVNYVKVPMYGRTQLYFCSPIYGHKDYNKFSCGLKIEGNENFINKLIEISKRIIKIKV